jgi:hypothetical protein
MKVLFIETTNATPHLETSLELAKCHLDAGNQVDYVFIGKALSYSELCNHSLLQTIAGSSPETVGISRLKSPRFKGRIARRKEVMKNIALPIFDSLEELRVFTFKEYSAGMSALSSLIDCLKCSSPDLEKHQPLLRSILESGISTYEYTCDLISRAAPDRVYVFNGRFANNRAIVDACRFLGVPLMFHERGANMYRYSVSCFSPHDFSMIEKDILRVWRTRPSDAESAARQFFDDRRRGADQGWTSFTKDQQKGFLPISSKPGVRRVVYFSSSDDECAAVGDLVKWERWPNQLSAFNALMGIMARRPDLELIVRLHPHLQKKDPAELVAWSNFEYSSNVAIIAPDSPVDTYSLLDSADVTVTCGSTVGIESVYWGIPSICLGPSLYSRLEAVHAPRNDGELEQMLVNPVLTVMPARAFPYGFYMSTYGTEFKYFQPLSLFEGRFMGENLQASGIYGFAKSRARSFRELLRNR